MDITYVLRDEGGCGYYRLMLPMGRIEDSGKHKVKKIGVGSDASAIYDSFASDVIVLPRVHDEMSLKMMKTLKEAGKKIVVDYDDNIFDVSPFSIHYKDFGREEVKVQVGTGEWMDIWTDGKNIDLEQNARTLDTVRRCLDYADLITVTQPKLAEVFGQYGKTACLPNCIDLKKWQKLPLQRRQDVRLYWSGGASHYEDWLLLQDVLPNIMKRYPQAKLVIMGTAFKGTLEKVPMERIEAHEWVHTQAYPYKTAILDADISLIPLQATQFNSGKSNIKWVEQAALGVPSVTSGVTPYVEYDNGINGIFVDNSPEEWEDAIACLIEDSLMRAKLGGGARTTVEQKFDIDRNWPMWVKTYEAIA